VADLPSNRVRVLCQFQILGSVIVAEVAKTFGVSRFSSFLAESLGGFRYGPPESEAAMKY
jgi:hypothetical protein